MSPQRLVRRALPFAGLLALSCTIYHAWEAVPLTEADPLAAGVSYGEPASKMLVEVTVKGGETYVGLLRFVKYPTITLELTAPDGTWAVGELVDVDLGRVETLHVRRTDVPASRFVTTAVAVVGGGAGAVVLTALLVLLLKGSCPFVYITLPNGELSLVAEVYSGAALHGLQRDDLLHLPGGWDAPILLANEAPETHYTDSAALIVVDHSAETRALSTFDANVVLVGAASPAVAVTDLFGADVGGRLATVDGQGWATDMAAATALNPPPALEGLDVRVAGTGDRVLELTLANTLWSDAVSARLWAAFGSGLAGFQRGMGTPQNGAAILDWRREAGFDLRVESEVEGVWTTVAWVPPAGWVAPRAVAVPLPAGATHVRLFAALGFWTVDSVAVSPVVDANPARLRVEAKTAEGWDGRDERAALASVDGRYAVLPDRGHENRLLFELPTAPMTGIRDVFLATNGYYEVHPPPQAARQPALLRDLNRDPATVSLFSARLFQAYLALGKAGVSVAAAE